MQITTSCARAQLRWGVFSFCFYFSFLIGAQPDIEIMRSSAMPSISPGSFSLVLLPFCWRVVCMSSPRTAFMA
jgi:hypothetical protein